MAAPTYSPGQVLNASDCNSWFTPLAAYKTADQNVTSSTALANDNTLFVAVAANAFYWFQSVLHYKGGVTGASDLKLAWTVPASATMRYAATYLGASLTVQIGAEQLSGAANTIIAGTNGTATVLTVWMAGHLAVAGTSGNLQLQWAQNTSSGTATTVGTGSAMIVHRIG